MSADRRDADRHVPPAPTPALDPRHDLADAPAPDASPDPRRPDVPWSVADGPGSRPIDRIQRDGPPPPIPPREPARRRLLVSLLIALLLVGLMIGAFVMQRPVPALGFAAVACGLLLLFAAPALAAINSEPDPTEPEPRDPRRVTPATSSRGP